MKRILVVGGHQTPALAVIDAMWKQLGKQNYEFVWVGREWAQRKNGQKAHEKTATAERGIRFYPLESGKSDENLAKMFLGLASAYRRALAILRAEEPDLVLSFGGFLAVPVAMAASRKKIPVITHEQTRVLGLANRIVTKFAKVLALSYPKTKEVDQKKLETKMTVIVTGNPIRDILFEPNDEPPMWWPGVKIDKPILYISGGSQGSQAINKTISELIPELTKKYIVVHQVGAATVDHNYVAEYAELAQKNGAVIQDYLVRAFLNEEELRFLYPRVSLAVARAGANSVMELASFLIPTLYIPLPQANYDEQKLNAEYYVNHQAAEILIQKEMTPETLRAKIKDLARKQEKMKKNLASLDSPREANKKMIRLILGTLNYGESA